MVIRVISVWRCLGWTLMVMGLLVMFTAPTLIRAGGDVIALGVVLVFFSKGESDESCDGHAGV